MRVPTARIEEKVTIVKLCEQVKRGRVFTKERTENLGIVPSPFYPNSFEAREGTFESREA